MFVINIWVSDRWENFKKYQTMKRKRLRICIPYINCIIHIWWTLILYHSLQLTIDKKNSELLALELFPWNKFRKIIVNWDKLSVKSDHLKRQSDQSTIWIIDVCAFFFWKFILYYSTYFLQNFFGITKKKPFIVIRKKF
jgi:hypothetical protein